MSTFEKHRRRYILLYSESIDGSVRDYYLVDKLKEDGTKVLKSITISSSDYGNNDYINLYHQMIELNQIYEDERRLQEDDKLYLNVIGELR